MEITVGYTKNDWTVTGNPYLTKNGWYAECTCSCGRVKRVKLDNIRAARSKSCGHNNGRHFVTHGMYRSAEHTSWRHMLERCKNPNCKDWPHYGGRGIKVCPEWEGSFETFYRDMGDKPDGMSLDRIDVDGDYEPGNCRWATGKEQARNTRENVVVSYKGQSRPISEWAEILGMDYHTLYCRLQIHGWEVVRAMEEPVAGWEGRKHRPETIQKMRDKSHAAINVTCPHCGKSGGKTIMQRWHFDRCKKAA